MQNHLGQPLGQACRAAYSAACREAYRAACSAAYRAAYRAACSAACSAAYSVACSAAFRAAYRAACSAAYRHALMQESLHWQFFLRCCPDTRLPAGLCILRHLGGNMCPSEGGFTPLPCRGIGSRSRRKAAFPTLFNSLLHTRSWSLSFSLTLLLMFEKIEDRRLYSCAHMWSFDFKVMYGSGLMASVDIQPGVTIWGCLQCHLPTASILPKLCLFSI